MKIKHLFYLILLGLFGWFEYATLTSTDKGWKFIGVLALMFFTILFVIIVLLQPEVQHKLSKFFNKKIF